MKTSKYTILEKEFIDCSIRVSGDTEAEIEEYIIHEHKISLEVAEFALLIDANKTKTAL